MENEPRRGVRGERGIERGKEGGRGGIIISTVVKKKLSAKENKFRGGRGRRGKKGERRERGGSMISTVVEKLVVAEGG